jgi:hypothetical protein
MIGTHPTGSEDVPSFPLGRTLRVRRKDPVTGNMYAAHVVICAGWRRTRWDGVMTHPLA